MKLPLVATSLLAGGLLSHTASALNILRSTSLSTCMENSGFSASVFNVSFTPDDGQLTIDIKSGSTIEGNVLAKLSVLAYGFPVLSETLDPCKIAGLSSMCPMKPLPLDLFFQETIDPETVARIPSIAYKIPDLHGTARMEVINTNGQVVACVEAPLSNGETVDNAAVGWVTAVVAGLALVGSAIISGMGHTNTAAHIAANALSLFGYFQAQAMVTMMAVPLPPLAAAWTQNFDWSVGIMNIGFMQKVLHWYVQATSGTPTHLLLQQGKTSIQIAKRSLPLMPEYLTTRAAGYGYLQAVPHSIKRSLNDLIARSNNDVVADKPIIVKLTGIERMSYRARIESSNVFMTSMSFFVVFVCLVTLLVSGFRLLCKTEFVKKNDKFRDFRLQWLAVLKGIMYRIVLIGFIPMAVFCPWEWTRRDSPAAITLAAFFFVTMLVTLSWVCFKIITIGMRSSSLDANLGPAYTLYSDPEALNRWGYLYVQFRTQTYYFIVPQLIYILIKALTIAFAQGSGTAQSFVILFVELAYLIAVCILHPWLDRRTNIINIAIAAVNFINAGIVMVFSGITGAPPTVPGVLGVVFFIINVIFALVLVVLLIISLGFALFSKDPEERYRSATSPLPSTNEKNPNPPRTLDLDVPHVGDNNIPHEDDIILHVGDNNRASGVESERGLSRHSSSVARPAWNFVGGPSNTANTMLSPSNYPPSPSVGDGRPSLEIQPIPSAKEYQPSPLSPAGGWHVGAGYDR